MSSRNLFGELANVLKPLPEDAEVFRASGEVVCGTCGKMLKDHERFAYPWGECWAVQGCDGAYYHL